MLLLLVSAALIIAFSIMIFCIGGIIGAMFPEKFLGDDPRKNIEEIIKEQK